MFLLVGGFENPTRPNACQSNSAPFVESSSLIASSVNSPSDPQQFSAVPTSIPENLSEATQVGPLSTNEQLNLQLVLPLGDSVDLNSFLSQVYDSASPLYHQFLTPSQFYSLYGPDPAEVAALTTYMQSNGLQLRLSATNPNIAEVSGTVAQIQKALETQIDSFSWNGLAFYSATTQAQLPLQFSNIQMIYGLENFSQQGSKALPLYRTLGTVTPGQIPTSYSHYYSPSEIRQAYNTTALLNAGYSGTGVSIAIIDAYGDPYIEQELKNFSREFRLPLSNGTLHIIPVGSYNPSYGITSGWNLEVALDVEWAHAMAPNATINLYIASDTGDHLLDAVLNATLGSDGRAYGVYHNNIISMSWGEPENDFATSTPKDPFFGLNYQWLNQVFQMDAALGITAFASSGDWGAFDQASGQTSPYGAAIWPSTDPYVTGVGGTSLYMNTTSGYYQWPYENATGNGNETAWSWNIYYQWGTGGGWSTLFSQPSWQTGPGVSNNGERGDPDIAWDADPLTGVLVSVFDNSSNDSWHARYDYYVVGGTSVGAPCWAGAMALIDQKAGRSLGLINPAIYSILNNAAEYSKAFHDIKVGNNNPYSATAGWDPLAGVGSPNIGELAYYLAPTGQLPVVVTNDFSNILGRAYAYRQVINLTAIVADNRTITGPLTATITSSTGATIVSGIVLAYSARRGAWLGSYAIKPTDPSGEWSVIVTAINGSSSGKGYTTLDVGDGVTIWPMWSKPLLGGQPHTRLYQIGDTIRIYSYAVDPRGQFVTNGTYTAVFYLDQDQISENGLGKVQGKIPLYALGFLGNSTDYFIRCLWEGSFTIPSNVDQGAWIMVVNGTDLNGNKGTAYTWINVGLQGTIVPADVTSAVLGSVPSYILGNKISISAYPVNENGSAIQTGAFTAMFYAGSTFLARVPLTFAGTWSGAFTPSKSDPTGFYTITVNGTDGKGNCGSFATVVEVAPYSLSVHVSVSNPTVPVRNGNESWALAKVTYPDGSPMTVGFVNGFVLYDPGGVFASTIPIIWFTMTYNKAVGGFVAANFLHTINYPLAGWILENTISQIGNYLVDVEAYDALGNYGNGNTAFVVTATNRAAIDIAKDADFTAANGVTGGNGTSNNPYLIAGWNVSSISIANVTSSYELLNDYVSGSAGNGITINTPHSKPTVVHVYTVGNKGDGLYANHSPAGIYSEIAAGNNGKDGILIANDTEAENGTVEYCIAYDNALNGIVYQNSNQPFFLGGVSIDNAQAGLLSLDSNNTSIHYTSPIGNNVGIEVTGQHGSWYGCSQIRNNWISSNTIGIYIDGLDQNLTTARSFGSPSYAIVYGNDIKKNGVGIYASNNAAVDTVDNYVYNGTIGISTVDSLAYLTYNNVRFNSGNGIQIVEQSPFEAQKLATTGSYQFSFGHDFGTIIANNTAGNNGNAGVSINDTDSALVLDNNVESNQDNGVELNDATGVSLGNSTTIISGNNVFSNTKNGIKANNVTCATIIGNNVTENGYGIFLNYSRSNALSGNIVASNTCNFGVYGTILSEFVNHIDTSNLVEGKPIYYFINQSNIVISPEIYPEVGYLGLVSCKNVTVQSLTLTHNIQGLLLAFTNDSRITDNNIAANSNGILLSSSSNNTVYHNNFANNLHQVTSDGSLNIWDNGYPSGGNYWTDYAGSDLCSGPHQNITGSDGIGDTPYVIDSGNADRYPLMNPYSSLALSVNVSPSSAALEIGQSQRFTSTVSGGTLPYRYQWYLNGISVPGANNSAWTFTTASLGLYRISLNVTDSTNATSSNTGNLLVNPYVMFRETGLPSGVWWSVTFNGRTLGSNSNSITFSAANGVYSFSVTPQAGYGASPASGSITVNGTIVVEQVTFIPMSVDISMSKIKVIEGDTINVNVTLRNEGNCAETFNITLYGSQQGGQSWPICTFADVTLVPNGTVILTTGLGFGLGYYTITISAYQTGGIVYTITSSTILIAPIALFRPWSWHRPIPV